MVFLVFFGLYFRKSSLIALPREVLFMLLKPFVKYVLPLAFLGAAVAPPHQIQAQENTSNRGTATFFCGTHKGKPATIADHPNRGEVAMIVWERLDFEGAGWPPQRRCREVSQRLQKNQEEGTLNFMVEGRLNGYPVICASLDKPENEPQQCSDETMLWTLHPRKDNPQKVIKRINNINNIERTESSESVNPLRMQPVRVTSPDGTQIGTDVDTLLRVVPKRENSPSSCLFGPCPNE
jgi:hypothetical protein